MTIINKGVVIYPLLDSKTLTKVGLGLNVFFALDNA